MWAMKFYKAHIPIQSHVTKNECAPSSVLDENKNEPESNHLNCGIMYFDSLRNIFFIWVQFSLMLSNVFTLGAAKINASAKIVALGIKCKARCLSADHPAPLSPSAPLYTLPPTVQLFSFPKQDKRKKRQTRKSYPGAISPLGTPHIETRQPAATGPTGWSCFFFFCPSSSWPWLFFDVLCFILYLGESLVNVLQPVQRWEMMSFLKEPIKWIQSFCSDIILRLLIIIGTTCKDWELCSTGLTYEDALLDHFSVPVFWGRVWLTQYPVTQLGVFSRFTAPLLERNLSAFIRSSKAVVMSS